MIEELNKELTALLSDNKLSWDKCQPTRNERFSHALNKYKAP